MSSELPNKAIQAPSPIRVLIVDDDPDYIVLIKDILADVAYSKCKVQGVNTISEAIITLGEAETDVCLCDFRLGEHTGFDLLKHSRAIESKIPIIILTGMGDVSIDIEAMKLGAMDYLPKDDLSPTILERAIRYAIERKRSEQEHLQLEQQLRHSQRMETIGTLAGGIAHDFNNILSPILCYSEMVLFDQPPDSPSRSDLEHVIHGANRAKDLVKQILAFSRQIEQEKKIVDIQLVVEEALKLLRASIPSTIEIRPQLEALRCYIIADPSQIHQVIMNLSTNAAHAMRETGGVLDVKLDLVKPDAEFIKTHPNIKSGKHVRLKVRDTGHGMEQATLDRIFEPFFTTKQVGDGTGLGLSVVHGIVLQHEGAITVESEKGKGTTFEIYLPIIEDIVEPKPQVEEKIQKGTECVLYVDDEAEIALAGKRALERFGYRVVAVTNSLEALRLFSDEPSKYDIVITDLTMPRLKGDDLAKKLMAIRPDIPVILTSGYSETSYADYYKNMGIVAFIRKPLEMKKLNMTVRNVLDSIVKDIGS